MPGHAQGFAGLGTDAEGFAVPQPDTPFVFPDDHGAHPDYRIEWWYLTANLTGPDGTEYGIQWTLFRSALAPEGPAEGWDRPQVWMGHAAVTTARDHRVAERFARGGIGQAGATARPFEAWIDDWALVSSAPAEADAYTALDVSARGDDFSYALALRTDADPVPQGVGGYSVKSAEGQASYYYSQPFYTVAGTLTIDGAEIPVTGSAWLDREWSSQPLSESQTGWDWFSLHLDSGEKVMAFRLRQRD
ncbi:MAG: lipocalin-like domain-containing protein, partial [Pseudomonadota bacterium]